MAAALVLVAAALLVPSSAVADAPPDEAPTLDGWLFEVQVVRVVNATAAMAEHVPAWTRDGGDARIALAWPRILELLKERGETTILLDGDTTTTRNAQTEIIQSRSRSLTVFDRKDQNNTWWKAFPLKEEVAVKFCPRSGSLDYDLQVTDWLPRQAKGEGVDAQAPPFQCRWHVKGTLRGGTMGRTFVLSHREQLLEEGQPPLAVEHYAFLTQRPTTYSR